ncbi:MAG: hypothetical protein IT384_25950 [Deltaproteobacteria bacterium]|nr:hypothetical protein [Deltaproteobacteria bacterium]
MRAPGTVLTYYGLRKLELNGTISDEEKLKEWQAFIARATEQIEYAKKAIERWKDAARLRVIEQVQATDRSADAPAKEKIDGWARLLELYPKSPEAKLAKKRIAHWRTTEIQRLVQAAEEVERSRASKVDRVKAWRAVAEWVKQGPEERAAVKRITALQAQLFEEAQSLDKIPRVDSETKIAVWRDVIAGAPTKEQRTAAEHRIAELEAEVAKAQK